MTVHEQTGVLYTLCETSSPDTVLLLVHGLGAHRGRWESLSRFFQQKGIASYAIDLQGFGETRGVKGHINSFRAYFDDIRALRAIISREYREAKVFLIGESLGGLIVFLQAVIDPVLFSGLVCISPAFKSKLQLLPFDYIKIFASLLFNPKRQFSLPFNARMRTRDTDFQAVIQKDEKEHRLASSKLLINTVLAQMRAGFLTTKLTIPALFLLAGEDLLVDSKASLNIFNRLRIKDKTIIQYPDMYHALSIDIGREKVFEDILKWVRKRLP
ncbi:MAG: alpha/beta fold hydrolase [Candidatus Omnitrophota bacterium]